MFHIIKDERLVSKMEGKTIFFEAPRNRLMARPDWSRPPLFCDRSTPAVY